MTSINCVFQNDVYFVFFLIPSDTCKTKKFNLFKFPLSIDFVSLFKIHKASKPLKYCEITFIIVSNFRLESKKSFISTSIQNRKSNGECHQSCWISNLVVLNSSTFLTSDSWISNFHILDGRINPFMNLKKTTEIFDFHQ